MTRDETTPLDADLLAALLAADAAWTAGGAPNAEPGASAATDPSCPSMPDLSGLIDLIRRLGPDGPTAEVSARFLPEVATLPLSLGRFEVIREIGQGGCGVVYLARDRVLGREVALKVPRAEVLGSTDARRRFLREGRAAAGLDHPHIIPVFDAGEIGPFAYIVSAYCEGPTLSAWLRQQPGAVPARAAARLLAALAEAVQHAHDRGILHRDLKPSNIMLQPGGDATDFDASIPRITDFGLARIIEETTADDETRSGVPFGSPPYMAPEQAAGKRRDVGATADVYALGATLYEVVTRRPPFQGESYLETLGHVLTHEPVPPRTLRPGLPRDLETICLKCLEKDPRRRYPSAAELHGDLERFLAGEPIRARPVSVRLRAAKWIRRRPMHATALVLAGLLASSTVGGIILRDALIQEHSRQLEREIVRADENARLSRRHLQAFRLRQAQQALEARQVERAQDFLATIRADRDRADDGHDPGDPGFALRYLTTQAQRDIVLLSDRQDERVADLTLSPDGRTLATGDDDGSIRLRDPETGRVRTWLHGHGLPVSGWAFSPDGRRLASLATTYAQERRRNEIFVWDLTTGRLLARLEGFSGRHVMQMAFDVAGRLWEYSWTEREGNRAGLIDVVTDPSHPRLLANTPVRSADFSRDGAEVILVLDEPGRRLLVRDAVKGRELGRTGPIDHDYHTAFVAPDRRTLAVHGASRTLSLWDIATGRERARFDFPRAELAQVRFSPDSRFMLLEFVDGSLEVNDLKTGTRRAIPPSVPAPFHETAAAFSPEGRFLATNISPVSMTQRTVIWQLDPWRPMVTYPLAPEPNGPLLFTPDAKSLIAKHGAAVIRWNYAPAPAPDQPSGHADEAWSLAFSPDGKTLASGSDDDDAQTIKLWDVATGRSIRGWHAGRGTVAALALDPRGRVLASAHLEKSGEVRLWDPANGRLLAKLVGHADFVRTVAFNPDGTLLASAGSDRVIRLWDMSTRRCRRELDEHTDTVRQVAFSPDGTLLASASNDDTIRLWDVATGRLDRTLQASEHVAAVAFAPDGRTLATGDEKGMVTIWELGSGTRIHSMAFEPDYLLSIAYSPDGRSLAIAGKARTIRLWDPVTGQELLTLDGHKGQVNGLTFSPDGNTLASCSHDGAIRLWRSAP